MDPSTNPQPINSAPVGQAPQPTQKTDVLGILSIVLAFIAPLIGFILGLVGVKKAKEEGRSPSLSKVGWILNLVFMILGILIIGLVIILSAAASKATEDSFNSAAKDIESSIEESTNGASNSELIAAYDKVTEGMSKADAEAELGSSSSCTSSSFGNIGNFETCTYGSFTDKVTISVTYKDGSVQSKTKSEY